MDALVGTSIAGCRITESLHEGAWYVFRGLAPDGARVIATVSVPPTPAAVIARLALPFEGIPRLRGTEPVSIEGGLGLAVIEVEPRGYRIGDLKWPMPIDEVITVGLDLVAVLERLHAAGAVHGSLRPQTTWVETIAGRCSLTGTTPRPELAGLHVLSATGSGSITPFADDIFFDDTLAAAKPPSPASDVAQLGMLLYRMATHRSPFAGETPLDQLTRAMHGDAPAWPAGDDRSRVVEQLARDAFTPGSSRSLAALRAGLERCVR